MIVTLTTDFGADSPYVAQMKGVILSINPAVTLVDVTHSVPPQSVRQGALLLAEATGRFPEGTIHVCVVDPGVGTDRHIVYAEFGGQKYIAPDNGVLTEVMQHAPVGRAVVVTNARYRLPQVSMTFHGRDIMAPAAAHLSLGLAPEELGPPAPGLTSADRPAVVVQPRRISGHVVLVDSFGNLISTIRQGDLAGIANWDQAQVHCGGWHVQGIIRAYAQRSAGSAVALIGSSGRLEIAVVNGSACRELRAGVGDEVVITW
jgi:S-adenosylmethionine hydrolase